MSENNQESKNVTGWITLIIIAIIFITIYIIIRKYVKKESEPEQESENRIEEIYIFFSETIVIIFIAIFLGLIIDITANNLSKSTGIPEILIIFIQMMIGLIVVFVMDMLIKRYKISSRRFLEQIGIFIVFFFAVQKNIADTIETNLINTIGIIRIK